MRDFDKIVELKKKGLNVAEIVEEFGFSRPKVATIFVAHGAGCDRVVDYDNMFAKRNGYKDFLDYQEACLRKRGFAGRADYARFCDSSLPEDVFIEMSARAEGYDNVRGYLNDVDKIWKERDAIKKANAILRKAGYTKGGLLESEEGTRGEILKRGQFNYSVEFMDSREMEEVAYEEDVPFFSEWMLQAVSGLLDRLNPRERRILDARYKEGKTLQRIADEDGTECENVRCFINVRLRALNLRLKEGDY